MWNVGCNERHNKKKWLIFLRNKTKKNGYPKWATKLKRSFLVCLRKSQHLKSSFDFANSNSFCAFETFSPTKRDLIYDGIQHALQYLTMLDILQMASLDDEIVDAKDLISKEVMCQENP